VIQPIDLTQLKGAIFSDDRKYRYALWRVWRNRGPYLLFIGLNPSTADQLNNDPTITRLVNRAYKFGYGGLIGMNLYALVSTDPRGLTEEGDLAIGQLTDEYLKMGVELTTDHLCGWGSFSQAAKRAPGVYRLLRNPVCLGMNTNGEPRHPLYIKYGAPFRVYTRGRYA